MTNIRNFGLIALATGVMAMPAFAMNNSTNQNGMAGNTGQTPGQTAETQEQFRQMDQNRDQQITEEEFTAGQNQGKVEFESFSELDMDNDGTITQQEFQAMAEVQNNVGQGQNTDRW